MIHNAQSSGLSVPRVCKNTMILTREVCSAQRNIYSDFFGNVAPS